ncbi:hypothetical protein Salat_0265100 [Sesamum alatum]|uniref:Uncharacterized protein n=1 Tax=Sesamum alatum TaxID=300844 RepID=A0AAE1YZV3_9LAMI|nr:hypothetical protein Salat_0265100 [Sesamum alatum]
MTENPKLEEMGGSDNLMSSNCESGELGEIRGGLKISVSDHVVNGLHQYHSSTAKSESFVVDMERFSTHLLTEKDINANSRITRNLSRKGSARSGEKKIIAANERDTPLLATSPRATLHGGSTPEKPVVVVMGPTDHSTVPQLHHQISFTNGTVGSESGGKRFSFRRSPHTWTIDPRRILLFFATLSCLGTIVLIYFTLSMGKLSGDDAALN